MTFIRSCLCVIFSSFCALTFAQNNSRFIVKFTDKNASTFSLSSPLAYLSQRAIDRRSKQGIGIKTNDLPVNSWYVDSVLSTGVQFLGTSKWFNCVVIDTTGFPNALAKINSFPFVQAAVTVGITKTSTDLGAFYSKQFPAVPKSSLKEEQIDVKVPYGAAYNYGNSFTQVGMIGADCMHGQGYKGDNMVVAVIDAGFRDVHLMTAFDSLRSYNGILGTYDFADRGSSVYTDSDDDSHGSYVLSCMAAQLPGLMIGTAPKAKYWLLRSEVAASENIIEEIYWTIAAEFADSVGADVINSSLGYFGFDIPAHSHTYNDMDGKTAYTSIAATTASQKGMVVVVSAGNSGTSLNKYIASPADADSILTVGAVDAWGYPASFSSRGPTVDGRVKPDVTAQGQFCVLAGTSGGVFLGNGTSFSSPIMAGAVTCLWQSSPVKNNMEIVNAVRASGGKYTNPDTQYGYGIPNMCVANAILNGYSYSQFADDDIFRVYPSPFDNQLIIEFNSESPQSVSVQLLDVAGRKLADVERNVVENSLTKFTIAELQAVDAGIYFAVIKTLGKTYTRKVVKVGSVK